VAIAHRHRLAVVEDCAQAHGARLAGRCAGTFGDIAAFSFYPTKNLGCAGDGGAVVTQDDALAARVRALRTYGWFDERRISTALGYNSRLDEMQAGILNALLPRLDEGNRERMALAGRYRHLLVDEDVGLPAEHPGAVHHQFAIVVPRRDALRTYLRECAGIETGVHYPVPLHRQPLFAQYADSPLPATDELAGTMVSLPIQPEVAETHIEHIARSVLAGVAECRVS
jgi:dTDP-4-amino-4,6-dideoxygalactose transaminase